MEKRKISEADAYKYASEYYEIGDLDFVIVKTKLNSSDDEDGGGDYTKILKEKSTGKFFSFNYTDWDISNTDYDEEDDVVDGRCDLDTNLEEVFSKVTTVTVYE